MEHMLFKGTETRTAKEIAAEFESIGGQVNAFTDKEYTCYFAKLLAEHLPHAIDVLADMFLNSAFDSEEIELEKNVVLEEVKRHEDTPDELVHDVFARTVWGDHPLGNSVLGKQESVGQLGRADLIEFVRANYAPDSIVISAAGNLVHEELVEKTSSLLGHLEGSKTPVVQSVPSFLTDSVLTDKSIEQVHFCIGTHGFSQLDPEKYTLAIIDTALGGGMSSRLFQEVREKRGLAYAIGSYSASYGEGGLFAVYGGTSIESVEEVLRLIRSEFASVRANNITDEELNKVKNQLKGALVLSQENMSSRMIRMAKSELYLGRVMPLEELISNVLKVTHDDIARVAERVFYDSTFPVVAVGPFKNREE